MELTDQDFNMTVRKFLEIQMGPQHISPAVVVPITVVYVLIFVSGVIGNVVVCLVISRNSHFQTPTNYYLFSLAISDLLILIFGLPNDLKVYWQQYPWVFGEAVCKLRALVAEMTSYASVLTIVAFTTERYVAICHPLFIQTMSTLSRAIKLITSVWIVACVSAIPFAIFTKINYVEYPSGSGNFLQESAFCALPMENQDINRPLVQFATFAFFCLPMTIIIILYAKISLKLRNSRFSRISSNDSSRYSPSAGDGRQTVVRRSINKMLVAVVIAFFICWAPFHAQRLLAVYVDPNSWTVQLRTLNEVLYYTAGCLYYFSATINPILYSLMSAKYRDAFKEALCSFTGHKRERDPSVFRFPRNHSENTFGHSDREMSIRATRDSIAVVGKKENETHLCLANTNTTTTTTKNNTSPLSRKSVSIYRSSEKPNIAKDKINEASGEKIPNILSTREIITDYKTNGITTYITGALVTDGKIISNNRTKSLEEESDPPQDVWISSKSVKNQSKEPRESSGKKSEIISSLTKCPKDSSHVRQNELEKRPLQENESTPAIGTNLKAEVLDSCETCV